MPGMRTSSGNSLTGQWGWLSSGPHWRRMTRQGGPATAGGERWLRLPHPGGCNKIATFGLLLGGVIPAGHEVEGCSSMSTKDMSTKEETTAATVRALNDALNARDREATARLFASDAVFRPGAEGAGFAGPDGISDAPFG